MSCETTQEVLTEWMLVSRGAEPASWDPVLRDHVRACAACTAHLRFLRALLASLASDVAVAPDRGALVRIESRAVRALRAHQPSRGFGRQWVAAVVVLTLGLPIAVAQAWLVAQGVAVLLEPIVPEVVIIGLGVFYFGTFLLMVGTMYACIPLWVATVRRARMEVS